MEVYAAFLSHTDHHLGRLIETLDDLGILDDTLVYYIIGDNGASAEGTIHGTFSETFVFNKASFLETPEFLASKIDEFGSPAANNHYAVGWAHAMDTPYQWTKQVASHWGGTRNGTIVHWPNGFEARGELRSQFCHVIDVAPTVLDAADLPAPTFVHGVQQMPLHGTSMRYSFDDAEASERHDLQYFEMFVNRGIYHEGWTAVTRHSTPWTFDPMPALDDDIWELYGPDDWTQARNIAADNPAKLAEPRSQSPPSGRPQRGADRARAPTRQAHHRSQSAEGRRRNGPGSSGQASRPVAQPGRLMALPRGVRSKRSPYDVVDGRGRSCTSRRSGGHFAGRCRSPTRPADRRVAWLLW